MENLIQLNEFRIGSLKIQSLITLASHIENLLCFCSICQ